jgi:DNA-binding SARP family transcriptional activator
MLYSYAVCDFLTKGDLAGAGELLRRMESTSRGNQRCALGHYHYIVAWYYFLLNDLPNAALHAEKGVQIPFETGMPFGEATSRILLAYVFREKGDPKKAFEQIEMARKIGRRAKSSLYEWLCDIADASVAFKTGQEKFGLESLKRAMAFGRAKGLMNMEGWLPSVMTELCLKALDSGIEVEYVKNLIRKRGLVPDTPPFECEDWPWPLKIFILGRFEIVRDEKPLQYPVRAPRVPLTLLKAIVAFGSGGVKEDQLVDTLWPEADGDTAHQTFKTTLHRLRQLIGDERAIQVREGRVTLDQQYCWVDSYAFEFLLGKAERLLEDNQKAIDSSMEGVRLAERALSLYKGTFLGEEANETWIIAYQERLRSKFIRAVRRLGNHFEISGQWQRAVECYQKGLEVDELAEEFYQRLMASHLSLGRRAEAIAVYNRCRKVLQSTLGLDPSPKTEEILKALKQKAKN